MEKMGREKYLQYYNHYQAKLEGIRNSLEEMVDSVIGRGSEKLLVANIRINTNDNTYRFSIAYYPKSNYVKVYYKSDRTHYEAFSEGMWDRISDHDSCWRDCWRFSHDLFFKQIQPNWKRNDYLHVSLERIKLYNVKEYLAYFSYDDRNFTFEIDDEFSREGNVKITQIKKDN